MTDNATEATGAPVRPRALVVLVTAGLLAIVASCATGVSPLPAEAPVTAGGSTSSVPPGTPSISWSSCAGNLECATVSVPLDYSKPDGRQIPIAVARHRATGSNVVGSLLLNPGGPGESGIDSMPLFLSVLSTNVQARFDLVTFDPRGVSRSEGIRCVDGPTLDRLLNLDPAPTTPSGQGALLAADRVLVEGCQRQSQDLLPFVGTVNAARDMDRIRAALGEPRLDYLGFSYGTLLGAEYAQLFPTHVRRMVLDGAVDPAQPPIVSTNAQSAALDQALGRFFADCQATLSCAWHAGGDLHRAFDQLMASIRTHPLTVGTRSLGPGEAFFAAALPLYVRSDWPQLAQALQQASVGDGSGLLALFDAYAQRNPDGTYADILEANTAINCADQGNWPSDPSVYPSLAANAAKVAPEFGPANVWGSLVCAIWPVRGSLLPQVLHAAGSPPIVVVGSTGDPITPYASAKALAAELEHGVLVTRVGEGHTGYQASACIRGFADGYLIEGTVPPAGTTCR